MAEASLVLAENTRIMSCEGAQEPPIGAEALLDLVQALGAQTSDNSAQREFGVALYKQYFEELPKQYGTDDTAKTYLREVLAATASAVRGFSVERTAFKRARTRADRMEDLRGKVLDPKFLSSPLDGENIKKIHALATKLIPSGGVAALMYFSGVLRGHPWWQVIAFIIVVLWVLWGDLFLTMCTIGFQLWIFRRSGDGRREVEGIWHESVPRYKALAVDLLVSAERIRERYYPNSTALIPQIKWRDVHPGDVGNFATSPNAMLHGRTPFAVLSAIVDMHFSLDHDAEIHYVPMTQRKQAERRDNGRLGDHSTTPESSVAVLAPRPVESPKTEKAP